MFLEAVMSGLIQMTICSDDMTPDTNTSLNSFCQLIMERKDFIKISTPLLLFGTVTVLNHMNNNLLYDF